MHSRCYSGPVVTAAAMVAATMHEEKGETTEKRRDWEEKGSEKEIN